MGGWGMVFGTKSQKERFLGAFSNRKYGWQYPVTKKAIRDPRMAKLLSHLRLSYFQIHTNYFLEIACWNKGRLEKRWAPSRRIGKEGNGELLTWFQIWNHLVLTQAPVTSVEAESVAKQIGAFGYFETSVNADEIQGVTELFAEAARIACLVKN